MLVAQMQQTKMCPSGDLLPPNMDWYTQKVWQGSDMPTDLSEEHGRLPSRTAIEQLIESVNCMRVEVNAGFQDTKNCVEQAKRTIVQVQAAAGNRLVYPALWTLEYHADENDVTRTLTIKFRSELSGKCFHDDKPIVITVGSEFLGKYGGYIKAGLSIFASVVPDVFGKSVIESIIDACSDQLDRTVQVHSLVKGLVLSDHSTLEMGQCRSLSPDETLALLRDLLWVYDPEFDEKKMTKYSCLECGVVVDTMTEPFAIASGTCLWAAREEIKQCEPNIVFAHDFADIKRDKPTEEGIHQPKQGAQPPTQMAE